MKTQQTNQTATVAPEATINGHWEAFKTTAGKPWIWRCNCGKPNVNWGFFCSQCHAEIPTGTEPS